MENDPENGNKFSHWLAITIYILVFMGIIFYIYIKNKEAAHYVEPTMHQAIGNRG